MKSSPRGPALPPIDPQGDKPRYRQLEDSLISRIAHLTPGDALPSIRELTAETGLSHHTVVKAMESLERTGFLDLVAGRGAYVSSRVKAVRSMHPRDCPQGTLVLAVPSREGHWLSRLVELAEVEAVRRGYGLLFFRLDPRAPLEGLAEFLAREGKVAGLLLWPPQMSLTPHEVRQLEALRFPVVVFAPETGAPSGLHFISGNPESTGRVLAETLLEAGHRKIMYVRHEGNAHLEDAYEKGIRSAIQKYGHGAKAPVVRKISPHPGDDSPASGHRAVMAIPLGDLKKATALAFTTALGALGGVQALREKGFEVPRDLGVIGSSDHPLLAYTNPSISATDGDWPEAMARAFDMVAGKATERSFAVLSRPVPRESIGSPRPSNRSPSP